MAKINNVIGQEVRRRLMDIEDLKHLSAEAQQRSLSAEEMARLAELLSKSTKEELDQIVIEGDSSVEAAQARVDAKGEAHKTLKERLDWENEEVNTQLAETEKNVWDIAVNANNFDNLQEAVDYCLMNNKRLQISDNYEIDNKLNIDSDLIIVVPTQSTIKLTKEASTVIDSIGKLTVLGELVIDANNLSIHGIYLYTELPHLEGIIFKNSLGSCVENDPSSVKGFCYFKDCYYIDCGKGPRIIGDNETTSVLQVDGGSSGTTGYDGNCYFFSNHKRTRVVGGDWSGDTETAPNIYLTKNVQIDGGFYHDIRRGATVGRGTERFIVANINSENCSYSGISVDIKESNGTVPAGRGMVANNNLINCGYSLYAQAKHLSVIGNYSDDHINQDAAFRFNEGTSIFLDGNNILGAGDRVAVKAAIGTEINYGKNHTDSTHGQAWGSSVDGSSISVFGEITNVKTANYNISTKDETILVDGSAGGVTIYLPSATYGNNKGKTYKIIRTDSSNHQISLSVASGGLRMVNGTTNYSIGQGEFRMYTAISLGNGQYIVN